VARKVLVEIELPEGVELSDVLKGVRYRVVDPVEELRDIVESVRRKNARIDRIPSREEIYRSSL